MRWTMTIDGEVREPNFIIRRALAIEFYANLEQALSVVFSILMKTDKVRSDIVFFKIINTSIRNKVIGDLLSICFGEQFDIYWYGAPGTPALSRCPGLFTHIRALDEQRNRIVHWHTLRYLQEDEKYNSFKFPHEILKKATSSETMTSDELACFCDKARVITRAVELFIEFISVYERGESSALHHIFQQPIPYPPSESHPLFHAWNELQDQPRSSRI
ncbi:MAG: hypothetical protein FD148_1898 [Methylocystaceae bacterium]|nr:MAG: hypothetical protein FD148_1898 [Methylocystaceae bacterium]